MPLLDHLIGGRAQRSHIVSGLSLAARNITEVFFILRSREQIAFSRDASTVLRG
jgi:hypothetical protein